MQFICYPKCSTCAKAEKWLRQNGIEYSRRDIKEERPTKKELQEWHSASGLPVKRFFNTSGQAYRQLELKDKLDGMNDEEKLQLLATDGMLVKRPLLINNGKVLVGFKEKEWENMLLNG